MSQFDGIRAEDIIVSEHAVCQYVASIKKPTSKPSLAEMAFRSEPISIRQFKRFGLNVKDDHAYEWRRTGKVLMLLRYGKDDQRRRVAIMITVLESNEARRSTTNHRNTVTKRPKKPRNRRK